MRSKYDLIIFDCDGTLVDSEYLNNKISSDLLIELGLTDYTPMRCMEEFSGRTWTDIKATLEARHKITLPPTLIETYIQTVQNKMAEMLKPIKGALDFVQACNAVPDLKICVGSNGQRENVTQSLNLQGFDDYFHDENTFTRIQVPNGKPAPDLFLFAAKKMGVEPARCLVLEDSATGVLAGVAAEMDVWGFVGASHDPENQEKVLLEVGASRVYTDFIHIHEMLDR